MLTYDMEQAQTSLYEYLYECIKDDIIEGNIKPDEHLPSKRSFAKHLGVSTITVENAYDQLVSEGYIYSIDRKGFYASDISHNIAKSGRNISRDIEIVKKAEYRYDLSSNQMSPDNFPFSIWAKLMRELMSMESDNLMVNVLCGGAYELRSAIAEHLRTFRGMDVDPDQIIVGAGTEYLYGLIIQLLGKDKHYCIENPGHKKIAKIYSSYDVSYSYIDMDENGISAKYLAKTEADVVHISPTHHFPTGITMPISRRYELLSWAEGSEDRYIIEDDYDSEFRLNGRPIPTMQSIDMSEKVIYMNTFSKSLASTIRISYMVLPAHLANEFYKKLSFYSCTVSTFEQYTLARFISRGYFEKHINRMRLYYVRQRKAVLECLDGFDMDDIWSIEENDSGLHFLLSLNENIDVKNFENILNANGIHLESVGTYYNGENDFAARRYILNYSNINIDTLYKALSIIRKML